MKMATATTSVQLPPPCSFLCSHPNSSRKNFTKNSPPLPNSPKFKSSAPPLSTTNPNSPNPPKKPPNFRVNHEQDAYPWSIPLHRKSPHAIYKDIQTFSRKNKLKEALTIVDYLEQQGIPVNVTTFSSLIEACIRLKSLTAAKQIHGHVRVNDLEKNEFLRAKIVRMYASCGSIDDAKRVLGDDPGSDIRVYSWNALLRGNVVSGRRRYTDVFYAFERMREMGVELNVYSFSCLIKSLAGAVAFKQGLKAHALLIKNGLIGNLMLKTSLIDLYFKCRKIKLARKVFNEMAQRDVVSWGAMIAGFAHNGLRREALYCVSLMRKHGFVPNSVVITTILPVIGELGELNLGKQVHAYAVKTKNYSDQLFIQSGLIDMYCKCGEMKLGRRAFYHAKNRNTVLWTALISGYISNGRLEQALRSVVWMQQEGFRPDVVAVATVLPVCAKLRALIRGKELHGYVLKKGFLPNVSLVTSLMVMYSKCGVLEYSCRLFDGTEQRNVKLWTALIDSYIENGCLDKALRVFRLMQLSKHRADSVTISRVLDVCHELRMLKLGMEIHGQVLKKGIEFIPSVSSRIIRVYGRCGRIDKAKSVFSLIPVQGSMTVTAMLEAYGYVFEFKEAINLFNQVICNGLVPNEMIFNAVLSICDRGGLADEACRLFTLLTEQYRIDASKEHYSVIIKLLAWLGRTEEAERYSQRRSFLTSRSMQCR